MFIGRHPLGVELPIRVICTDVDDKPIFPDSAPQMDVLDSSGTVVFSGKKLFPLDRPNAIGAFWLPLFLTSAFVVGHYHAIIRYQQASTSFNGVLIKNWEVVPGGNEAGAVISMHYFERPTGKFLVYQSDGGYLFKGKNPQ